MPDVAVGLKEITHQPALNSPAKNPRAAPGLAYSGSNPPIPSKANGKTPCYKPGIMLSDGICKQNMVWSTGGRSKSTPESNSVPGGVIFGPPTSGVIATDKRCQSGNKPIDRPPCSRNRCSQPSHVAARARCCASDLIMVVLMHVAHPAELTRATSSSVIGRTS